MNQAQVSAALRHVGTMIATALGMLALGGYIQPENVQPLLENINNLLGQLGIIIVAASSIYASWMAFKAQRSASPVEQIKQVRDIANDASAVQQDSAKEALIVAAAAVPGVEKVVAPALATATPALSANPKVTPQ